MVTLRTAKVKYAAGKVFDGEWGKRQNIKVTFQDGTEDNIWFAEGRQPHCSFRVGDEIQILFEQRDGKTTKRLVTNEDDNPPPPKAQSHRLLSRETTELTVDQHSHQALRLSSNSQQNQAQKFEDFSPDEKREIAAYVASRADLLKYCVDTAHRVLQEDYPMLANNPETLQKMSTNLFLTAQRKFNF